MDMKLSEMEKKEGEINSVLEKPSYPYGLRIYLDPDSVKKLNLKDPQVGDKMMLEATVEVMSVNAEMVKGDVKELSVGLQIKEMVLESGEEEKAEVKAEDVIYK